MTKRERLQQELYNKELILEEDQKAIVCNCLCHSGVNMVHFMECCSRYSGDIEQIKSDINVLKKKLRIK